MPVQLYVHTIYSRFQLLCFMTNLLPQPRCINGVFFGFVMTFFLTRQPRRMNVNRKEATSLQFSLEARNQFTGRTNRQTHGRTDVRETIKFALYVCFMYTTTTTATQQTRTTPEKKKSSDDNVEKQKRNDKCSVAIKLQI